MMKVSVLGLGAMGRAFAARAVGAGHEVTVWNRSPGRAAALVKAGAREATSAALAVEGCDVALVVVSDDAAVREVADAVVPALPDGAVLVNCSTTSPELAVQLAAGSAGSVRFVEAPVMGSPQAVEGGTGRFFVAGERATVDELGPLWSELGVDARYCGPVGTASVLKILSNVLLIVGVAALGEVLTVARGRGIPDELLREVYADSVVTSPAQRLRLGSLLSEDHPGWFGPALALKDLRLGIGLGAPELDLRIAPAAAALLQKVDGASWPDITAVIEGTRTHGDDLEELARLLRTRDELDERIAGLVGTPGVGHFLAREVFDIGDGRFRSGPLKDRTVTVTMYGDMAGGLDLGDEHSDFHLVVTGPSAGGAWRVTSIHLFDAAALHGALTTRGVEQDVATSLSRAEVDDARIHPDPNDRAPLRLTAGQRERLALFSAV